VRRRGVAPRRHRDGLAGVRGVHRVRRPGQPLGAVAQRARQQLRLHRGVDPVRRGQRRPAGQAPPRDRGARRVHPRGDEHRLRPRDGRAQRTNRSGQGRPRGHPQRAQVPGVTDVLLLWHMHQPRYVHPLTGRPVLPWVRLHAASGYLDMARALAKRPGARVTVNFVPSLVEQLQAMVAGTHDALEDMAKKRAADLDEGERIHVLLRSFSVRRDRGIDSRPRYAELLAKRGDAVHHDALAERARRFTSAELRDVECLFLLAWLGFAAREDHPEVDALDAKGHDYSEEDKDALLAIVRAAAAAVLPAWRDLAARGQIELAASPYYHPIVPLVIDSDAARRSRPPHLLP